jgi:tetratricopeptide (TPR) repeat protein
LRRIALHEYLSQIEGLVDDNRLPEAAAHSHYVLQQYPRHIGAYRLFGRSLLEQQLFEDAIDVFERILSADPEDLVSHAGLALAYSESRDLERAIWHMERAFEVDPYNRAVQDELRKLFIARDGDAPSRLSLTRAALARLHLRAALYQLAAAEFSQLVASYPERVDLKLALAETYYRDDILAEAAGLCQEVLATLPYSIKANAILADAFLNGERIDEARLHLRRVQDLTMLDRAHLDPDTTLGQALGNPRISLPDSVQVEVLEDTLSFAKGFEESGAWPDARTAVVVDGETMPDWLQDLSSPESPPAPIRPLATEQEPEPAEMTDWLAEVVAISGDGAIVEQVESTFDLVEADGESAPDGELEPESIQSEPSVVPSDSLEAVLNGLEPADEIDATADAVRLDAAIDELVETEPEPAVEVSQKAPPIWEDERLLDLDELKSYIDGDSESPGAGGGAPEWLDELTDRSDVTDELPRWLHEAVGFDAPDSGAADLLNPAGHANRSLAGDAGQGSEAVDQEELSEPVETGSGNSDDTLEGELGYTESRRQDVASRSDLPDWLLEGDEVLDELPGEFLQADAKGRAMEDGAADDTMVWLDELAEQLNDASGASATAEHEDRADERPTDKPIS